VNRADIMTKIEALIRDPAAWPGERDAARGRLAAIKSKYRRMSDAEISAAVEMLSAAVKQLTQKKEELHLFKAERFRPSFDATRESRASSNIGTA
jgi:hypothetical protein